MQNLRKMEELKRSNISLRSEIIRKEKYIKFLKDQNKRLEKENEELKKLLDEKINSGWESV